MNGFVPALVGVTSMVSLFNAPVLQFSGDFLELALVFFVLALLAAVVGAGGVAGVSMEIAKVLVAIFLILAVASLLL